MDSLVRALEDCQTQQDIRKIWIEGCLHLHPDKVAPNKRPAAEVAFKAFAELVYAAKRELEESAPSSGSTSPMSVD